MSLLKKYIDMQKNILYTATHCLSDYIIVKIIWTEKDKPVQLSLLSLHIQLHLSKDLLFNALEVHVYI